MPDTNWIGDPSPSHPLPMRLRSCNIEKRMGGSFGWRGYGYAKARLRALYLSGGRSTVTGSPQGQVTLEVDHIDPYRCGGITPHSNEQTNLRVLDSTNNRYLDYAQGFAEKRPKRRLLAF